VQTIADATASTTEGNTSIDIGSVGDGHQTVLDGPYVRP